MQRYMHGAYMVATLLGLLSVPLAAASAAGCDPNVETCPAASDAQKANTMLQVRTKEMEKALSTEEVRLKPPEFVYQAASPLKRSGLSYFKHWSRHRVQSHKKSVEKIQAFHAAALGQQKARRSHGGAKAGTLSASGARELLSAHRRAKCPKQMRDNLAGEGWKLVQSETDAADGTQHLLYRGPAGDFQYVATHDGALAAADPPACAKSDVALLSLGRNATNATLGTGSGLPDPGDPRPLTEDDPTVSDCVHLFARTFDHICGHNVSLEVLGAQVGVIDGFDVRLHSTVTGSDGTPHFHEVECLFEYTHDPDASLIQAGATAKEVNGSDVKASEKNHDDMLPEERAGMLASLRLQLKDLCDAETVNTSSAAVAFAQARVYGLGELSRYKGYEHIYDDVPDVSLGYLQSAAGKSLPDSVDLRDHGCFPDLHGMEHAEVVRNQGGCGSCWAFASASAAMQTLCASVQHSAFANSADRFELSVQQIMSCNTVDGGHGCNGGHAGAAIEALKLGLTKERDAVYLCGSGDPENHFEEGSGDCYGPPWGASCRSDVYNPDWHAEGIATVRGEPAMMAQLVAGYSSYVSFDVYENFDGSDAIYTHTSGAIRGGHAVTLVGYGTEGGVKYWIIQNSWGYGWAMHGYKKFKRGINLAGIEEKSVIFRVWADGGHAPPCYEPSPTGYYYTSDPDTLLTCDQLSSHCSDSGIADACPITCGTCTGPSPGPAPVVPPESPTQSPESPTQPPESPTQPPESPTQSPAPTPLTTQPPEGGDVYVISDARQLECADGSVPITSAGECMEAASAQGLSWAGTEELTSWPTNCYVYNSYSVYFNYASVGSAQCYGAPLCVIGGSGPPPPTSLPTSAPGTTQAPGTALPDATSPPEGPTPAPGTTQAPGTTLPDATPPPASDFSVGVAGTLECAAGSAPITSADKCSEAALATGRTFSGTEELTSWPANCYVYGTSHVYFNYATPGSASPWGIPLCAAGGGGSGPGPAPAPAPGTTQAPGTALPDATWPPEGPTPAPGTTQAPGTTLPGATPPPAGDFSVGGAGTLECAAGSAPITSADRCREAASATGRTFSGTEELTSWPGNCYVYGTSHVYFNYATPGSASPWGAQLCAAGGGGSGPGPAPAPAPGTTQAPLPIASYVVGTWRRCPSGSDRVMDSKSDCITAADLLGIPYADEESTRFWPTGCYVYDGHSIYFNHHTRDKQTSSAAYVCVEA